MTPRVPFTELEELDPHWPFAGVLWKGQPFTGIGFEETPRYITEYRYENGYGEGRCISTFRSGQLMEEFLLHQGVYVGESRSWFQNGQLRRFVRHSRPRLERQWNEAGVLLEEYDEANATRRKWFSDGAIKSVRVGDETKEYTHSGELAFTWRPREVHSKVYARIDFVPDVMSAHLEALADDRPREDYVFAWVHSLLDEAKPEAFAVLRRLLAHPNDWVRLSAMRIVGNRRVRELASELRAFLGDLRVAASQSSEHGSRSATHSFDAVAREELAKLT